MEGGGSEVARLCVGDVVGAVGPDDGALFKWAGTFFGWACSGGLKMGAGGWRRDLGKGEGEGEGDGDQLLWLADCIAL